MVCGRFLSVAEGLSVAGSRLTYYAVGEWPLWPATAWYILRLALAVLASAVNVGPYWASFRLVFTPSADGRVD